MLFRSGRGNYEENWYIRADLNLENYLTKVFDISVLKHANSREILHIISLYFVHRSGLLRNVENFNDKCLRGQS